eukprot:3148045-Pyramimonas_sp.AAC.1
MAGQRIERTLTIHLRHRQQRMSMCMIFTVSVQRSCWNIAGQRLGRALTAQLKHRQQRMSM